MSKPDPESSFVHGLHAERLATRDLDELLGLCKGVLADGNVSEAEARFLKDWMERHRSAAASWPGSALFQRLNAIFEDGHMDGEEEAGLLKFLMDLTGGAQPGEYFDQAVANLSTRLPLDDPMPEVDPTYRYFCLTGKFLSGTRQRCEDLTRARKGVPQGSVTLQTNYLVIGVIASSSWMHSAHGRKIERAVELREQGHPIAIIDERAWALALSKGMA